MHQPTEQLPQGSVAPGEDRWRHWVTGADPKKQPQCHKCAGFSNVWINMRAFVKTVRTVTLKYLHVTEVSIGPFQIGNIIALHTDQF